MPSQADVIKVMASRAVYVDENDQRIEIKIMLEDHSVHTLTLTQHHAHKLITDLLVSWEAINPRISTGRIRAGWEGF